MTKILESKKIKVALIVVAFATLLGVLFGIIDYNRLKSYNSTIFCLKTIDEKHSNETCWGLGYKIQKEINIPKSQPIRSKNSQKFGLWLDEKELYSERSREPVFTLTKNEFCMNLDSFAKILYYTDDDIKYYLHCLDEVKVNMDNKSISLKEALKSNKITVKKIISYLSRENVYDDGGTIMYRDYDWKYSDGMALLKCNTLEGNNDIYIGPISMQYAEGFCK